MKYLLYLLMLFSLSIFILQKDRTVAPDHNDIYMSKSLSDSGGVAAIAHLQPQSPAINDAQQMYTQNGMLCSKDNIDRIYELSDFKLAASNESYLRPGVTHQRYKDQRGRFYALSDYKNNAIANAFFVAHAVNAKPLRLLLRSEPVLIGPGNQLDGLPYTASKDTIAQVYGLFRARYAGANYVDFDTQYTAYVLSGKRLINMPYFMSRHRANALFERLFMKRYRDYKRLAPQDQPKPHVRI